MNPILFTVGGYSVGTMLLLSLVFTFAFVFFFWMVSRKDLKNDTIYDIAFITIGISFLCARIIAFIDSFSDYSVNGWSFFPFSEINGQTLLLEHLPWSFFAFNDGHFSYIGIIIGLIVGVIFLYLNSNRSKSILLLFDRIIISYTASSIFLFVGMILAGLDLGKPTDSSVFDFINYGDGINHFPIQVFQILFMFVLLILFIVIKRRTHRNGVVASLFLFLVGLFELILRSNVDGYSGTILNTFDLYQLIALVILLFGLLLGVNVYQVNIFKTNIDGELKDRNKLIGSEKDVRGNSINTSRFAVSYANRKGDYEADFTPREKVSKGINTIKRKLSQ